MGVVSINERELLALSEGVARLHAQRDLDAVCHTTVDLIGELIACDWGTVSIAPTATVAGSTTRFWSPKATLQRDLLDQCAAYYDKHPFWRLRWRHFGPEVLELSDLVSVAQLDRLAVHHEIFEPLGVSNMIGSMGPASTSLALGAIRESRRAFTDGERLILQVIGDHTAAAWRSLGGDAQPDGDRLMGVGRLALDHGGNPTAATPGVLGWLAEVSAPGSRSAVPAPLAEWIARGAGGVVEVERDGRLIRCVRESNADPHPIGLVVERWERAHAGFNGPALEDLSPREREVAHWVAEGKTNPEIGTILSISPRTVQKHLQRVFEKMGVPTRTALVAEMARSRPAG